jgi:hypothetical protein
MSIAELPGDVLIALRESEGFTSYREFASTLPMDDSTLWRLEKVKWGTTPKKWSRRVERRDVEALVSSGWIKRGDAWWERFRTAFSWQHIVYRYGERVYEGSGESLRLLEPVWEEHVLALVEATVHRHLLKSSPASVDKDPSDDGSQALAGKVYAEVMLRLSTTGFLLAREAKGPITPRFERTRSLNEILTLDQQAESAYMRTLLLAMEWAQEVTEEALDDEQ